VLALVAAAACAHAPDPKQTYSAEQDFLEQSLLRRPADNPTLVFLLFNEYAANNQQRQGIAFIDDVLEDASLDVGLRAVYRSVQGAMKAQIAQQIPLSRRIRWVKDAIATLDEAVESTRGELYIVRWLRAIVLAQLPPLFDREAMALEELRWAEANIELAPAPGLLREVLFLQAKLLRDRGDARAAAESLARSGYADFDRPLALTTPFVLDREIGFAFDAPAITEVVPGRVFEATGYDFMEYYFVVSEGGHEMFSIDAGSRGDSMETVLRDLRAQHPNLPPLTQVFVTHAHWDHVGGQRFLRGLRPAPQFHARSNYGEQLEAQENTGGPYSSWWGTRFDLDAVTSFEADHTVSERARVDIDGSTVEMIPIEGGETRDAMLIHFPQLRLVFAGDMIMPYLGAPFVAEGGPDGLVRSLDVVATLGDVDVLHGHQGINRIFPTTEALVGIRAPLAWLTDQTRRMLAQGRTRADIHHANLTPIAMLDPRPDLQLPYLVIREHLINRVVDDKLGYWQGGYAGGDSLSDKELGAVLVHYADLDAAAQRKLLERMIDAGDHELALRTVQWLLPHRPDDPELNALRERILLRLVQREQNTDAFKFIWYGGGAGFEVRPPRRAKEAR
jgi:glyoxylase-like metal-dependent hydrolase (beta-lactamase superfamily II)